MSDTLSVTIYADSDGFITFECPYCGSAFKLSAADLNDEDFPILELFCPYCGLAGPPERFISADVMSALETKAHNYAARTLNKAFGGMGKGVNRKKGLIHTSVSPIETFPEEDVSDDDTVESIFTCKACQRDVKVLHNIGMAKAFCPYCGVDL
jgi:predicted RNA-binding Zn-ribbon protein involved in translation (DUF1610 family)